MLEFNKRELLDNLFPKLLYNNIHFLTSVRRRQFNLVINLYKDEFEIFTKSDYKLYNELRN